MHCRVNIENGSSGSIDSGLLIHSEWHQLWFAILLIDLTQPNLMMDCNAEIGLVCVLVKVKQPDNTDIEAACTHIYSMVWFLPPSMQCYLDKAILYRMKLWIPRNSMDFLKKPRTSWEKFDDSLKNLWDFPRNVLGITMYIFDASLCKP